MLAVFRMTDGFYKHHEAGMLAAVRCGGTRSRGISLARRELNQDLRMAEGMMLSPWRCIGSSTTHYTATQDAATTSGALYPPRRPSK